MNDGYKPNIISTKDNFLGRTYGEWTADWWNWIFSVPKERNTLFDGIPTTHADENNGGPIYFLAGTLGGNAKRAVTICSDKAVLIPVINCIYNKAQDGNVSEPKMRQFAQDDIDNVDLKQTKLTIDNTVIPLDDKRVQSPLFNLTIVSGAIDGAPAGETDAVSDGYWVIHGPFPPREKRPYEVTITGVRGNFRLVVTYELTVVSCP